MNNYGFLKSKVFVIVALFVISFILLFGGFAHTYWDPFCSLYLPDSLCLIYFQLYSFYSDYAYSNSIDWYLLGYAPFTPFLTPSVAGIPTYPYFGSPFNTAFPYQTPPGAIIPYARFDYPAYVYGSPDFFLSWVLLQYL